MLSADKIFYCYLLCEGIEVSEHADHLKSNVLMGISLLSMGCLIP
jgi:hypothetical protein